MLSSGKRNFMSQRTIRVSDRRCSRAHATTVVARLDPSHTKTERGAAVLLHPIVMRHKNLLDS